MAHKKGQGSTSNGRDSNPQHRGIKAYGGQTVTAGSIIVRQCGTKFHPGRNVRRANDDSLFAAIGDAAAADGGFLRLRRWALLELLYSCGLRLAEAHGLDRERLDLRGGQVRVLGKGGKERVVPLGRRAADALRALKADGARVLTSSMYRDPKL